MPRETPRPPYLPNCPRFVFGEDEELALSLPSSLIDKSVEKVGGDIEADSGRRAAFVVRSDELFTFTLRFWESEWPAVQHLVDVIQDGQPFDWFPDQFEMLGYRVSLVHPEVGTSYSAVPHPEYPVVLLLTLTVRVASIIGEVEECGEIVFQDGFEGEEGSDLTQANIAFQLAWPAFEGTGGYGVMEAQTPGNILGEPVPFGNRFVGHTAIAGGSAQFGGGLPTYGRARALHRQIITTLLNGDPVQPNTEYMVHFSMNMGWLQSSEIGAAPGPHTVSVGMLDDNGRGVVNSLWCWYAVGTVRYSPSGSEDPEFPPRNKLFTIPFNSTQMARELFVALDGWKNYSFFTRSNDDGEIGLTFGRFDTANYAGGSGFDQVYATTICPEDEDAGYPERDIVLDLRMTQLGLEYMQQIEDADLHTTQMVIEYMTTITSPDEYTTQMGIERMTTVPDPDLYMTQLGLEFMVTDAGS